MEAIINITDQFCREYLNDEYAEMCRKMVERLSRKRPSPLLSGKPITWACGIVRTIGWVNFLDDPDQSPHMRLTEIDRAFGVGSSTGQGKSATIRKTLKIAVFDPEWTLPSLLEQNPAVWMLSVDGFLVDAREASLEIQQAAFERGLIPYVPAERM